METVQIVGAGLAGCEAAWQAAEAGVRVTLDEMRPQRLTPAHKTGAFGELVCSNSLKSELVNSAPWLLKEEMRRMGSLLMRAAETARVPGGHALTVDRSVFSEEITRALESHPRIEVRRGEVTKIPAEGITVIATGPLTSDALAQDISRFTGAERLYFYDSISPIVAADSVDMSIAFRASRYGKSLDQSDDYINCPFSREQYEAFVTAVLEAESYEPHIAEDQTPYFEGCLPIEELARRGRDTLRFGPMKPVGLLNSHTGRRPWAVVQLRQEDQRAGSYNLVGFQNHMKFGDQARVMRMIPGLEGAEFLRFGQIHRNTYINAPSLLLATLQLRAEPRLFFAGQICGVEGYAESIATGLLAGRYAAAMAHGLAHGWPIAPVPRASALGSLCHYITQAEARNFQPANITFDLLPSLDEETRMRMRHDKNARRAEVCRRSTEAFNDYLVGNGRETYVG